MFLKPLLLAFSLFSRIPLPTLAWQEVDMRYLLCYFPLVGVPLALLWIGWAMLCRMLTLPLLLQAVGLCLLPILYTGGIHLDGYADTWDALSSCAPPVKKQAILSDPHCGAFAVIRVCGYFLLSFALCGVLQPTVQALVCVGSGFFLSRSLSALCLLVFPSSKKTGMAHTFTHASSTAARTVLGILSAGGGLFLCLGGGWIGRAMLLAALLAVWRYYSVTQKHFGGTSGDLAGWFLQTCELWMLMAAVIVQLLEERI